MWRLLVACKWKFPGTHNRVIERLNISLFPMKTYIHLATLMLLAGLQHALAQVTFAPSNITVRSGPASVTTADINGDGKLDLICTHVYGVADLISVLTNNGSGGFALSSTPAGGHSFGVVAADDPKG